MKHNLQVNMMALRASGYLHPELAQELTNNVAMVLIIDGDCGLEVDPAAVAREAIRHRMTNAGTYGWESARFEDADIADLAADMADAWAQWARKERTWA